MALYRLEAKLLKRSSGRSSVSAAAYRSGDRLHDKRQNKSFSYQNKSDIVCSEIFAPSNAPEWAYNRETLWNRVEAREDSSTRPEAAQTARDITLSLPRELSTTERQNLVQDFVTSSLVRRGMIVDVSIHCPLSKRDNQIQPHAHLLVTLRRISSAGFGKKERSWNQPALLQSWRKEWEEFVNRALELSGSQTRVDHRSLSAQGILRKPEPKIGVGEFISDRGEDSYAVRHWETIQFHNDALSEADLRPIGNPTPDECRNAIRAPQGRHNSISGTDVYVR